MEDGADRSLEHSGVVVGGGTGSVVCLHSWISRRGNIDELLKRAAPMCDCVLEAAAVSIWWIVIMPSEPPISPHRRTTTHSGVDATLGRLKVEICCSITRT